MNSTNYWDKPRRGAQSKAVEDTLWSQRGTISPRRAEAPAGQGVADSWASVVRGNLIQRGQGQPRTGWTRRWNRAPSIVDTTEWSMANPRSALRKTEAARRRRLREPSREPSFLQHAVATQNCGTRMAYCESTKAARFRKETECSCGETCCKCGEGY